LIRARIENSQSSNREGHRAYLDTSEIGGYFDVEWMEPARRLWRQMEAGKYRFVTSAVTTLELAAAPEAVRELFASSFPPRQSSS